METIFMTMECMNAHKVQFTTYKLTDVFEAWRENLQICLET